MRKFLVAPDGTKYELPPITFEEFEVLDLWQSDQGQTWDQWLRLNNFHEADSFDIEFLIEAILVIEAGEPTLNFYNPNDPDSYYTKDILPYLKDGEPTVLQGYSIKAQSEPSKSHWKKMKEDRVIIERRDGKLVQYKIYSRRKREAEEAVEREKLANSLRNQAAYD
jgi:hypothetical protein